MRFDYQTLVKDRLEEIKSNYFFKDIVLELTNHCNFKCIFCENADLIRPRGLMSDDVFNRFVDLLKATDNPIRVLSFAGCGEPLLHNSIFKYSEIIKSLNKVENICMTTNGALLSKDKIAKLVVSAFDRIYISVNADSSDVHTSLSGVEKQFDLVVDNIRNLVQMRNQSNSKLKVIVRIVANKINGHEVDSFIQKWRDIVDWVGVYKVQNWGEKNNCALEQNSFKGDKLFRIPCIYLWDTLVINWNGDIPMCCRDGNSKYDFGNIKDLSLLHLYSHQEREYFRKLHLVGEYRGICEHCNNEKTDVSKIGFRNFNKENV